MSARRGIGILGHWAGMTDAESERAAGQIYARALREAAGELRVRTLLCDDCPCEGELRAMADRAEQSGAA